MWIVLLDHSGSMGDPFSGSPTFSGRSIAAAPGTKLDAACHALSERVRGLAPNERVVVIAFTSTARIVFDGMAAQFDRLEAVLAELQATNGTSVAAAFDAAVDLLMPSGKTNSRVLLVSDCRSELSPAIDSADRLIQFVYVIDVLLIDPDPGTEAAARAIIRLGEVQAVVSPEQLRRAVSVGDATSQRVATSVGRAIEDADRAARKALERMAEERGESVGSEVGFSVGYKPLLRPGHAEPLVVVVHPAALKKQVSELLERMLAQKTSDAKIAADGRTRLPKGAVIRIEPVVPDLQINPARIEVLWDDRIEDFGFTMSAPPYAHDKYVVGSVNVWYGPAQIASLPVSVQISATDLSTAPAIEAKGLFGSVFPSYSRKDKSVVDRARGYYEALGIAVLQDTETLRASAGEDWERVLDGLILKADAFQLYWSNAAAKSRQVEREWRFALGKGSFKKDRWIRPLRWLDDVPDLPAELAHLQMGWLPGFEDTRSRNPAADSIRCIVTPLVDCPPEQRKLVERDCREAIHHVETVTGLRCFPPPVLLIDKHVIPREAPHGNAIDENMVNRFAAAADLLTAMSLDIHTRFGRGKLHGEQSPRVELNLSLDDEPRRLALNLAEWIFASVGDSILGISGFVQPRKNGVADGRPVRVLGSRRTPSERLAEAVSSETATRSSMRFTFWRDRTQLDDTAIDWLEKTESGLEIKVEDQQVKVEADEESLRAIALQALTPAVASALDNANPLAIHQVGKQPPEVTVFAWLAPTYYQRFPDRRDCAAIAESIGVPRWRSELESFIAAVGNSITDPIELFAYFLKCLERAFAEVQLAYGPHTEYVTGYSITPESLETVRVEDVDLRTETSSSGTSWTYIAGTIPALKRLYTQASDVFLQTLRSIQHSKGGAGTHVIEAHTYGVFIPAGAEIDRRLAAWAATNGISEPLTFPGSDRILLCLEDIRRHIQEIDDADARSMFRRSVLIHEFLHATIWSAVGPDERRQRALREARNAEESLAVWLELDAARNYPAMRDLVEKYISSGTYPQWPYAGTSTLESKFVSGGRHAIQSFVRDLIDNPKTLQHTLDAWLARE